MGLGSLLKSVGLGGDVVTVAEDIDRGVDTTIKNVQDAGAKAGELAVKAAIAPTTIAVELTQGDVKAIENHVAQLAKDTADVGSATAKLSSAPYFFAADVTRNVGGDGIKIVRGAIAGKLVEINLAPILLRKLGKLDAQTPEEIAAAIAIAPIEILLAAYLQAAHDTLEPAAQPIPKAIKKLLKDHFDPALLDNARYLVSAFGLTLPEAINGTRVFMGDHAFAVTVGNVIVFSIEPDSSDSSIRWWAHELWHVAQYAKLGIDGFASKYVKNYPEIEQEAEAKAEEVIKAL